MICERCRRDVDHVRSSFWHREARICQECLAQWCDGDNDEIGADAASVGNYVRLRHGLPPLAAVLALLLLTAALLMAAPAAQASRRCLDDYVQRYPSLQFLVRPENSLITPPIIGVAMRFITSAPACKAGDHMIGSRPKSMAQTVIILGRIRWTAPSFTAS